MTPTDELSEAIWNRATAGAAAVSAPLDEAFWLLRPHSLERSIAAEVQPLGLLLEADLPGTNAAQWRFLHHGQILLSFLPTTGEWYAPPLESFGKVDYTSQIVQVAKEVLEMVRD